MDGYIGTIMMCGFTFAPRNWYYCQGGTMTIAQNEALYSLIGTIFGGNGRSDFGLPNLGSGRVPGGQGTFPGMTRREVGQYYGAEQYTISVAQLPAHGHNLGEHSTGKTLKITSQATVAANKSGSDNTKPDNTFCAPVKSGLNNLNAYASTSDCTMNSSAVSVQSVGLMNLENLYVQNTGGSLPMTVVQPTLIVNYVICATGQYPSRS